ncbi:MAG: hypothetical protein HYY67_00570 [Thaumarchaeota archaeon]|nr:hypothetical protein [Nitrososphaerota archaeon]
MRHTHVIVFKNLGLILQVNGLFSIIPVAFAIAIGEEPQAIAIFLASFVSLALGFFLTTTKGAEKANYANISILVVVSFIVLGVIGSIPYLYLHNQLFPTASILTKITTSYFESISAMTTTGLTVFDPAALPKSLIFYRAVTEWLGGVGIIFFILLFLNTSGTYTRALEAFGGFARLASTARGTYLRIMQIYAMYTILFSILLITFGFMDPFSATIVSLTGMSTGGMLHTGDLSAELNPAGYWLVIILMITGATSFPIHERIWNRKIRGIFSVEFKTFVSYLIVILLVTLALSNIWNLTNIQGIIFHLVSGASTTGFQYIRLDMLSTPVRLVLTIAMLVGGCSFSTAGGLKVIRMIIAFRSVSWLVKNDVLPSSAVSLVKVGKNTFFEKEIATILALIFAGVASIIATTAIVMLAGHSFLNSFFESVSAFSTTGLSTGVTSINLPNFAKTALIIEMIVGRLEVIPVLITIRAVMSYITQRGRLNATLVQLKEISHKAR